MTNIMKKRTWAQLKELQLDDKFNLDYIEKKNRYKIIITSSDTTFFINIFKPNTKMPIGINQEQNDQDYNDFISNFLLDIDNTPPVNKQSVNVVSGIPLSAMDGEKLAVHSSYKPYLAGTTTYAVWTGSGDDLETGIMCDGPLLEFNCVPGVPEIVIDAKFDQVTNGRVWIHEGYLKFEGGGTGDYMDAKIIGTPTPVQTSVYLNLELDGTWIVPASGGPGTGTHGFADPSKIVLLPRTYSSDGSWDFDGVNLIPNLTQTGKFRLSTIEVPVNKYMNKLPTKGTCSSYFSMTSDSTTELYANYFMRLTAHNISNTSWFSTVIMEIYRERTFNP